MIRRIRLLGVLGVVAVVFGAVLVASQGQAAPLRPDAVLQPHGCGTVDLVNAWTGLAVSVELGSDATFPGELRARATKIGPWEKFTYCIDDNNVFTLKSLANGEYVSCEENFDPPYQYLLRARASTVGSWEKYVRYSNGDTFGFTGSPSYWVTGDLNFTGNDKGILLANRKTKGSWETWAMYPV